MSSCRSENDMSGPRLTEAACATPAGDRLGIEPRWNVGVDPDGAWVSGSPTLCPNRMNEEGVFPIAIQSPDGKRVIRGVRSRWSRTEQGRVDVVQMLCRLCSAPLKVRDVPVRLVGKFACELWCSKCSQRGTIADGSSRTLLVTLKVMIEEVGFTSRRYPEAHCPRPWSGVPVDPT